MSGDLNNVLALPFGAGIFEQQSPFGSLSPPPPGDVILITESGINLITESGDQYIIDIT